MCTWICTHRHTSSKLTPPSDCFSSLHLQFQHLNLLFLPWGQYLEDSWVPNFPSWHEAEMEVLPVLVRAIPLFQPSCFNSNEKQDQLPVSYFSMRCRPFPEWTCKLDVSSPNSGHQFQPQARSRKKKSRSFFFFCFVVFGASFPSSSYLPLQVFFYSFMSRFVRPTCRHILIMHDSLTSDLWHLELKNPEVSICLPHQPNCHMAYPSPDSVQAPFPSWQLFFFFL